jgi:hypothetical protein
MKKKASKVSFLILLLFGIVFACQKEVTIKLNDPLTEIMKAQEWYESTCTNELVFGSTDLGRIRIIAQPDWDHAIVSYFKDSKTVEAPLFISNEFGFSTEESYKAAITTGDKRFKESRTTLVIETNRSITLGFLMTIIPNKDYLVEHNFEAYYSTYKKWQEGFSGYVLYHNLDGSFSNGWKLSEGKVVEASTYAKGKENTNKSILCYYYFFVLHITECGPNITKGTNGCRSYEEWYYMFNDCENGESGGGGGDGSGGYVAVEVQQNTPNTNLIYNLSSTLSPGQKNNLEAAIVGFINEYSETRTIWNYLVSHGMSIIFKIGPTFGNAAAQIVGNTITFREEDCITTASIREEFIHKYQGFIYGTAGQSQNQELEAKVLQDYLFYVKYGYNSTQAGQYFNNPDDFNSYIQWLDYVKITGYVDRNIFNDFCSVWSYPGPQNGNVDYGFDPLVLNNFIQPTGIIY